MLNEQPSDYAGFVVGQSMLASYISPVIDIGRKSGVLFAVQIGGTTSDLIGKVTVEIASATATGANTIWCPIISDTISGGNFSSTNGKTCPFDLTITQAKKVRVNFTYTSGTGTPVLNIDANSKPL